MTEPTVNVPLLRKAVEWAEAEAAKPWPKSAWNQGSVEASPAVLGKDEDCGTCYCIAGYVASLDGIDGRMGVARLDYALDRLGLSDDGNVCGHSLFDAENTIEDVRRIAESIAGERL